MITDALMIKESIKNDLYFEKIDHIPTSPM